MTTRIPPPRSPWTTCRLPATAVVPAAWAWGGGLAALLAPATAQDFFPAGNPFTNPPATPVAGQPLAYDNGFVQSQTLGTASPPDMQNYNLKLGPVYLGLSAGTTFTYTSNYNLVSNSSKSEAESDFTMGPTLGLNLLWEPSATTRLSINIAMTYQWSLNNQIDRISLSPNSQLGYRFSIGEVGISLYNTSSTQSSATLDPVISGAGSSSVGSFNRINNTVGANASWSPVKDTDVFGGYSFGIVRGLSGDSYNALDNNVHNFNLGVNQHLNELLTVGLAGSYNITSYLPVDVIYKADGTVQTANTQVQNDSTGWSVGPTARWQVSPFITASGSVQYQAINYQQDGVISDTSNFGGITFNLALAHIINQNVSQNFSGGRSVNQGTGSNYTENYNFNYGLTWNLIEKVPLNFGFTFTDFQQSGPGFAYFPIGSGGVIPPGGFLIDTADGVVVAVPVDNAQAGQQYRFSVGTSYRFTPKLSTSLSYSYVLKTTDQDTLLVDGTTVPFGEYGTSSVTLSLAYHF